MQTKRGLFIWCYDHDVKFTNSSVKQFKVDDLISTILLIMSYSFYLALDYVFGPRRLSKPCIPDVTFTMELRGHFNETFLYFNNKFYKQSVGFAIKLYLLL